MMIEDDEDEEEIRACLAMGKLVFFLNKFRGLGF